MRTSAIVFLFLFASCSADPSGGGSGNGSSYSVSVGEGIDFNTKSVTQPGHFKNSDLYAVENGLDGLKLISGGPNSTKPSPVNWFKLGGVYQTFGSLAEVPSVRPSDSGSALSLPHAKIGNGFVVKNYLGFGYTRGWISYADEHEVVLEFSHLD